MIFGPIDPLDGNIYDCHYCAHATCEDNTDPIIFCYCEDGGYFSHQVKDPIGECCGMFEYCPYFPKC